MTCDWFEREGLLLLERGEPLGDHASVCEECRHALVRQRRLAAALAEVGSGRRPEPEWQARVWAAIAARSGRRRLAWLRWLALPAAAATAAAVLVAVRPAWLGSESAPALELTVERSGGPAMRGESYRPGDRLVLRASSLGRRSAELRVYLDDTKLLLACGGPPRCSRDRASLVADLSLPGPGRYQVVLVVTGGPVPPARGSLDADSAAAVQAGASVELREIEAW